MNYKMKVTYWDQIETHKTFSRKMRCKKCGKHKYEIVRQLRPYTRTPWFIRCPNCDYTSETAVTRIEAIAIWRTK